MIDPDRLSLPAVPRALKELTVGGQTVPYRLLYKLTVDGVLPVEQDENGRYSCERNRLQEIAALMKLPLLSSAT